MCHALHDSSGDLDQGEDQRPQRVIAHFCKHMAPERDTVQKLPVGHWLGRLLQGRDRERDEEQSDKPCHTWRCVPDLAPGGDGVAEVHGELTDVDKGMVVGCVWVHACQLHQGALHEVDGRQSVCCRQLAGAHKRQVQPLRDEQGRGMGRGMTRLVTAHTMTSGYLENLAECGVRPQEHDPA